VEEAACPRFILDSAKKPNDDEDNQPGFWESNSVVEQAERHRLGTVRLPIESLCPDWHERTQPAAL